MAAAAIRKNNVARFPGLSAALLGAVTFMAIAPVCASDTYQAALDFVVTDPTARIALATDLQPSPDPSVVDLAVFYGQELLERGQSLATLDQVAETMVAHTNSAFAISGVPVTLRITYAAVFDESLDGVDTHAAFDRLFMRTDELRDGLMTDFGADAVVLIKATDDADSIFGFASLGSESALSDPSTLPRAVVCLGPAQTNGLECFGQGGIFAHEVGHLFGAGHQRNAAVGGSGGAFEFSAASGCGGGTAVYSPVTASSIYSTPTVVVDNEPCGIAASAGPDGEDNAHTIDLTRSLMAALRATMPIDGIVAIENAADFTMSEGDTPISLQIKRTGDLTERARVSLAVVSRTNLNPDIGIDPQQIVFEPGQDSLVVEISVIDDQLVEPTENVLVSLRNPWRLSDVSRPIQISIVDNDDPPPAPAPPPPAASGGGATGLFLTLLLFLICDRRLRATGVSINAVIYHN